MENTSFNVDVNELRRNKLVKVDSGNKIINNNPDFTYPDEDDKKIMMTISIEDVTEHGLLYVMLQDIKLPWKHIGGGVISLREFDIGELIIDLNKKELFSLSLNSQYFELLNLEEDDKRKMLKGLARKMLLLALEIQDLLPSNKRLNDTDELIYKLRGRPFPARDRATLVNTMGFKPSNQSLDATLHQSVMYVKIVIKDSLRDLLLVGNGFSPKG